MTIDGRRAKWLLIALAAIVGGLALRGLWSGPVAKWGGEVLYAVMVYALLAAIRTMRPAVLGVASFAVCLAIELFQLTGVPAALGTYSRLWWLVLGSGFSRGDLLFYFVGAAIACWVHHGFESSRKQDERARQKLWQRGQRPALLAHGIPAKSGKQRQPSV